MTVKNPYSPAPWSALNVITISTLHPTCPPGESPPPGRRYSAINGHPRGRIWQRSKHVRLGVTRRSVRSVPRCKHTMYLYPDCLALFNEREFDFQLAEGPRFLPYIAKTEDAVCCRSNFPPLKWRWHHRSPLHAPHTNTMGTQLLEAMGFALLGASRHKHSIDSSQASIFIFVNAPQLRRW